MKKLLLGTAAIAMGAAFTAPAQAADGVTLDLGGHFKGYVFYADQDDVLGAGNGEPRTIDALRETEIHFTGETTLDNGLTVGAHFELNSDGNNVDGVLEGFEESYAYFSGAWGRVNFGAEDGAAYLLQVAAPSADSNYDGIRQYVSPFNYSTTVVGTTLASVANFARNGATALTPQAAQRFDYDHTASGYKEKITYLTPVLNGFQAGVSYTPELGIDAGYSGSHGTNMDDVDEDFGEVYEVAARYEGQVQELGITVGGGYSHGEMESDNGAAGAIANEDDHIMWNIGVDMDYGPFGIGVAYLNDNQGRDDNADRVTWVLGADYTTGPFKLGASYMNNEEEVGAAADVETNRYTGGVVYTYGPGMTFRGTLTYIDHELPTTAARDDIDGTALMLGTQINF